METLFETIQGKDTNAILKGLETKIGLDQKDELNNSPLHLALALDCDLAVIQKLLTLGFSPTEANRAGDQPWELAARFSSDFEVIVAVWQTTQVTLDGTQWSPLMLAVTHNQNTSVVLEMVESNWNLNYGAQGLSALRQAVVRGDLEIIEALLRSGASASECTENGMTVLMNLEPDKNVSRIVRLLVQAGTDISARDAEGDTVLHWACFLGWTPVGLQALLNEGASVHAKNTEGITPILSLARGRAKDNRACFQTLMDAGADMDTPDEEGWTLVMSRLIFGSLSEIEFFLSLGASLEARDKEGNSVLGFAISSTFRGIEVIQKLVGWGANLTAKNNRGETLLDLAKQRKSPELVEDLLTSGLTDVGEPKEVAEGGFEDNSAFLEAARHNPDPKVLETLLIQGVSHQERDLRGFNALMLACASNPNPETVQTLLRLGFSANQGSESGLFPLAVVGMDQERLSKDNQRIIQTLLDAGADVTAKNKDGESILITSLWNKYSAEELKLLLLHGALVNEPRGDGVTPLQWAISIGRESAVIRVLLDNGADVNAVDVLGESVLGYALDSGWGVKKVRWLIDQGVRIGTEENPRQNTLARYVRFGWLHGLNLKIVQLLLGNNGGFLNWRDEQGYSILHNALFRDFPRTLGLVKLLLGLPPIW